MVIFDCYVFFFMDVIFLLCIILSIFFLCVLLYSIIVCFCIRGNFLCFFLYGFFYGCFFCLSNLFDPGRDYCYWGSIKPCKLNEFIFVAYGSVTRG